MLSPDHGLSYYSGADWVVDARQSLLVQDAVFLLAALAVLDTMETIQLLSGLWEPK